MAKTKTNEIFSRIIGPIKNDCITAYGNLYSDYLAHIEMTKNHPHYVLFQILCYIFKENIKTFSISLLEGISKESMYYLKHYDKEKELEYIINDLSKKDYFVKEKYHFSFLFEVKDEGYILLGIKSFHGNLKEFKKYIHENKNKKDIKFTFMFPLNTFLCHNMNRPIFRDTVNIVNSMLFAHIYKSSKLIKMQEEVKDIKIYSGNKLDPQIKIASMLPYRLNSLFTSYKEVNTNDILQSNKKLCLPKNIKTSYIVDITYNDPVLTDNKDKHFWLRVSFVNSLNSEEKINITPITNVQKLLNVERNVIKSEDSPELEEIFLERQKEDLDFILENFKKIFSKYIDKDIADSIILKRYKNQIQRGYYQAYNSFNLMRYHSFPKFILNIKYNKENTLFNFDIVNTYNNYGERGYSKYRYLLNMNKEIYNRNLKITRDIIKFFYSKKFSNHFKKTAQKYKPIQKLSDNAILIDKKIKEREYPFDLFLTYGLYLFDNQIQMGEEECITF